MTTSISTRIAAGVTADYVRDLARHASTTQPRPARRRSHPVPVAREVVARPRVAAGCA